MGICTQNHKTEFLRIKVLKFSGEECLITHAFQSSIVNLDKNTRLGTPLCKNAGYAPEVVRNLQRKLLNSVIQLSSVILSHRRVSYYSFNNMNQPMNTFLRF